MSLELKCDLRLELISGHQAHLDRDGSAATTLKLWWLAVLGLCWRNRNWIRCHNSIHSSDHRWVDPRNFVDLRVGGDGDCESCRDVLENFHCFQCSASSWARGCSKVCWWRCKVHLVAHHRSAICCQRVFPVQNDPKFPYCWLTKNFLMAAKSLECLVEVLKPGQLAVAVREHLERVRNISKFNFSTFWCLLLCP